MWQALLVLAALDSAAAGAWGLLRPADLFTLLQHAPSNDGLLLCRVLGFLFVAHAPCLLLAALRPGFAALALPPLLGRLLSSGLWLWLLGSGRVTAAAGALLALLAHDAVWPPLLGAFLMTRRANRAAAPAVRSGASPASTRPASPPAPPA